jgi:23S rRNA (cytosine1962-C5)-methyltransferase
MPIAKIILKSGKERSIERFHPWVFSGAIQKINGDVKNGDIIDVFSSTNKFLARGHYSNGSIAVRLLTFIEEDINKDFFQRRLHAAFYRRESILLVNNNQTNAYRLVHGEGDDLPGLIIDYYDGNIVVQCHHTGMHQHLNEISEALKNIFGKNLKSIFDKSKETLPKDYITENKFLFGENELTVIHENGNKFEVNWVTGQKTGFFLDQRDNRKLLGEYSKGKKILNTFCYSGGFSIYALKNGAKEVHSLDSSKKAIELTENNLKINGFEKNHQSIVADAIPYMNNLKEKYDIIILDPPAFAKHLSAKHNAIQAYRRLNEAAIRQLNSGGILFTYSCSQAIDKETFRGILFAAAAQIKKPVKILHQLHQGADHPIHIFHPEGEYLKGLVLLVE